MLCVKGNRPTLHDNIKLMMDDLINSKFKDDKEKYTTFCTNEKNRSRGEKRVCYLLKDISWLEERSEWKGLNSVFAIEGTVKENEKTSEETSYYISSLKLHS